MLSSHLPQFFLHCYSKGCHRNDIQHIVLYHTRTHKNDAFLYRVSHRIVRTLSCISFSLAIVKIRVKIDNPLPNPKFATKILDDDNNNNSECVTTALWK